MPRQFANVFIPWNLFATALTQALSFSLYAYFALDASKTNPSIFVVMFVTGPGAPHNGCISSEQTPLGSIPWSRVSALQANYRIRPERFQCELQLATAVIHWQNHVLWFLRNERTWCFISNFQMMIVSFLNGK